MKTAFKLAPVAIALIACLPAKAWNTETHRRIAMDAIEFMKTHPAQTKYAKLLAGVTRAGYTMEQFAAAIGQGAHDVDYFEDTYICGATTGNCANAPLWGLASDVAHYTSFWHFQNRTAGQDAHGNRFGGYNYAKLANPGDIDKLAATWLVNDYLDDGAGGMNGWFGDATRYNSYGVTEAHYRQGSSSTPQMYEDYQKFPFQPIDNLGQYFFSRFLQAPSAQSLGFSLHTTDLLQPHHTYGTLGNGHSSWEGWVGDNYDREKLNDGALVLAALNDFTPLAASATDIRPLLNQGGAYSYKYGGAVLSSSDNEVRKAVARKMVPHSIAMAVRILDRAAERLAQ
ncbi:phospholipase [Massilia sp. Dwa41.01b]|uniref:phospholipase n=1 Tax=unclassified Massilia TaxID=2609279 RepID=UPI001603CEBD|nr:MULTISPECIES: phospholipase [unclassified Massilia]QNA89740.1 phospholipase [Massilia sp. Dwa41.01b]QNB00638.1 phospholipase [Massilia sp. Se16.2.3]